MTDINCDAFRKRVIAEELVFADEGLSSFSLRMNSWRYEHLLGMAKVAAKGSEKVTVDENFSSADMMAFLDERFKLASAGLFSLEDLFEAFASADPSYGEAPSASAADFSAEIHSARLEALISQSTAARPWRENESALKVTKTAFPGSAPEVPLPPDLRK